MPRGTRTAQARPARRGVRRGARAGVAGRGADDRLRAVRYRHAHRDRHAPVLERAGGVRALDLEVDLAPGPLGQHGRWDQWRRALPEGDHRRVVGHRQPVPVLPDKPRPRDPGSLGPIIASLRRAGSGLGCSCRMASLLPLPLHAHHAGDRAHHVHATEIGHARGQGGVRRGVGDDDELGVVAAALLAHRLDRHVVAGERLGDPGQHAWFVGHVQRDVVAGQRLAHRQGGQVGIGARVRPAGPGELVARDRDDVAEHGARRRHAPGTSPVEHQPARGLRLDEHRVVSLADPGQRVRARDHRRMHPHRDPAVAALADRQQLDHVPELAGAGDVGGGDPSDPLPVHAGRGDPGVEREPGQDGGLGGSVEPLDVGGRVSLRVTERLRLLQRVREAGPGGVHLVEDVVGGAVDDAEDLADRVPGQGLAQRAEQRYRPGHGRLVVQVGPAGPGRFVQGRAVLREQRLVGGHHGLA